MKAYEEILDDCFLYAEKEYAISLNTPYNELEKRLKQKQENPNSIVPKAKLVFFDVNESEDFPTYHYNPLLHITSDDEVFQIADVILNSANIKMSGCKLLLASLIFYLVKFRPVEDRTFRAIMKLLKAVNNFRDEQTSTMDFLMDVARKEDPNMIAIKLYSGFQMLPKEKQREISIVMYELLIPFELNMYQKYNELLDTTIELSKMEYPCFMLTLSDMEHNVQDKIIADLFTMQKKKIIKKE